MTDAFDYVESREDADELIAEFGRAVLIRRMTNSGDAWSPTQTPTDYATNAAKVEFSWRQVQDGGVLASDQRWLIAAGPLVALGIAAILPGDKLVVDGVALDIVAPVETLAPAGVVVMFDAKVRL